MRQTQSRKQVDRAGTLTNLLSVQLALVILRARHPFSADSATRADDRFGLRATRRPAIGMTTEQSIAGVKAG